MAQIHEDIMEALLAGGTLTAGQALYLQARGCPVRYWELSKYRQAKHLYSAGFSPSEIVQLMPDTEPFDVLDLVAQVPPDVVMIAELTAQGKTVQEISKDIDLPRPTIYYHLNDLGLAPARERAPEITVSKQRKVEQLYDVGVPYGDIARRTGLTYDQVRAAIRRTR